MSQKIKKLKDRAARFYKKNKSFDDVWSILQTLCDVLDDVCSKTVLNELKLMKEDGMVPHSDIRAISDNITLNTPIYSEQDIKETLASCTKFTAETMLAHLRQRPSAQLYTAHSVESALVRLSQIAIDEGSYSSTDAVLSEIRAHPVEVYTEDDIDDAIEEVISSSLVQIYTDDDIETVFDSLFATLLSENIDALLAVFDEAQESIDDEQRADSNPNSSEKSGNKRLGMKTKNESTANGIPIRKASTTEEQEALFTVKILKTREGQAAFRKALIKYHGCQCLITGNQSEDAIEAAHIHAYSDNGPFDKTNGLLLRSDIHRLFDKHKISVHPETLCIYVADSEKDYIALKVNSLNTVAEKLDIPALQKHYDKFVAQNQT